MAREAASLQKNRFHGKEWNFVTGMRAFYCDDYIGEFIAA
jgi:hypothetical protein